ncbi:helix-turn-helix domain-containing protein [Lacticaseibacillus pantheris]|uniref:helix-turn-helix domain-containing protein n=1 Tax=Lacticaseibacillus pantheris TaxID=171523 RepID=UPI00265A8A82|nr:helix-turn-helix transcriptional regulator [Lacticaseibacillus pantheris]WKF84951.1 helix-turn-helix transcriptional regulator [Lacticaseibacillus pantheris]
MHPEIGSVIRTTRDAHGQSVDELAAGICPPDQLSAIEAGAVVPNIATIIGVSQRLGVRLNHFALAEQYPVGRSQRHNTQLASSLADGDYLAVKRLLNSPDYADANMNDAQAQAYYFYLGVADLMVDANLDGARYNLHMAINVNPQRSSLTALCYAYTALVAGQGRKVAAVTAATTAAMKVVHTLPFSANVNATNYLCALAYFYAHDAVHAAQFAVAGLRAAAAHHDRTLVLHAYSLLAQLVRNTASNPHDLIALGGVTDWTTIMDF